LLVPVQPQRRAARKEGSRLGHGEAGDSRTPERLAGLRALEQHAPDGRKRPPAGILCAGTDITGRRRAEQELLKRWRIMEQTPASIITGHQGAIEYVNPFFSRLTGYSEREAIGQNPRILNSGLRDEAFFGNLRDTISGGGVWRGEICNRKKDGALYWEQAHISPVKDEAGRSRRILT
jgi:PAS domain S-box-containing protein